MTSPRQEDQPAAPLAPKNGLGITGFVLGLIGLIFSFMPVIGFVAWPFVIVGIVLTAIGLGRIRNRTATNKGLTVAGLVLSVIGLTVCILWDLFVVDAGNDEASHPAPVPYSTILGGDSAPAI